MIDILLATYNGEKYIEQQIDSIRCQTYCDWQLLIHDDGSTDNTIDIVKNLSLRDSRIKLIEDGVVHLGVAKHFIHLLKYSTSPFVMFCDQDDIWLENKVERMFSVIAKQDSTIPQVVYSNAYLWNPEKGIYASKNTLTYPTTLQQALFLNTGIQGASAIFNLPMCIALQRELKYYAMHDHVLLLLGITLGEVHYLNEPLMKYRQHSNNVTGNAPGSIRKKLLLMWKHRNIPLVSRPHYDGLRAFYDEFNQDLSSKDRQLIEVFLGMPSDSFLRRLFLISRNRFKIFDSTTLLILKACLRKYI